ncbi:hypothetical protein GCM10027162_28240 [Streptomyces incanus]
MRARSMVTNEGERLPAAKPEPAGLSAEEDGSETVSATGAQDGTEGDAVAPERSARWAGWAG